VFINIHRLTSATDGLKYLALLDFETKNGRSKNHTTLALP